MVHKSNKKSGGMKGMRNKFLFFFLFVLALIGVLVIVEAVSWNASIETFQGFEGVEYYYNISNNVTGVVGILDISFVSGANDSILWDNGNEIINLTFLNEIPWFSYTSEDFILSINSLFDNQSGLFRLLFRAKNETIAGPTEYLYFTINATNDMPTYIDFTVPGPMYVNNPIEVNLTGVDEEEHYPLVYNITFNSCDKPWDSENCTIPFQFSNVSGEENTSKILEFVGLTKNNSGIYNVTICMTETLPENESLLPFYRVKNYTTANYNCSDMTLDLRHKLEITGHNCSDFSMKDNETTYCQINITTELDNSPLNFWSSADLTNNTLRAQEWFSQNESVNASNYTYILNLTIDMPGKQNVGFWNVTFFVNDTSPPEDIETTPVIENFLINITQSKNETPTLTMVNNLGNFSVGGDGNIIRFDTRDNDYIIFDKRVYDESITFDYTVLNLSNMEIISGFSNFNIYLGSTGINASIYESYILFIATENEIGDYTINLSATDLSGNSDYLVFNVSFIDNEPPEWNQTSYNYFGHVYSVFNNSNFLNINLSEFVNDSDTADNPLHVISQYNYSVINGGDHLLDSSNFNSSTGLINISLWKERVGVYEYRIFAKDSLGLSSNSTFFFNITNDNSAPNITDLFIGGTTESFFSSGVYRAYENNLSMIDLDVLDFDFLIRQKSFFNETLTVNTSVVPFGGVTNPISLNFLPILSLTNNSTSFRSSFTPIKSNVGDYNVTLNISDKFGNYSVFSFILNISEVNNPPFLFYINDSYSAVGRTFEYQLLANDSEDGNSLENFTLNFSYEFLSTNGSRIDFDLFNGTTFNSTTGKINLSLNSSHAGKYHINITVTDQGIFSQDYLNDTQDFWLYVYDFPKILYYNISNSSFLMENKTFEINVSANNSMGEDLLYELWFGQMVYNNSSGFFEQTNYTLRNSTLGPGNGSNFSIYFDSNFYDETYSYPKNLTLRVSISNYSLLINSSELVNESNFSISVSHQNFPIIFQGIIPTKETGVTGTINISLLEYFNDLDYYDIFYNQSLNFSIQSNETLTNIFANVSEDLILSLTAKIQGETIETINITGFDLDLSNNTLTNATSNSFIVKFINPEVIRVPTPTSSTKTVEVPVSLKILVPGQVSTNMSGKIIIPIRLYNDGKKELSKINLSSAIFMNASSMDKINMSFDSDFFDSLKINETRETNLTVSMNLNETGMYEILINATVLTPKYMDWAKIQLVVQEREQVFERIIFAEELIAQNPECLEIKELVNRAKQLYNENKFEEALAETNRAIEGCRDAVSQKTLLPRRQPTESLEDKIVRYLLYSIFGAIILGILYYYIKRFRLKKQ